MDEFDGSGVFDSDVFVSDVLDSDVFVSDMFDSDVFVWDVFAGLTPAETPLDRDTLVGCVKEAHSESS